MKHILTFLTTLLLTSLAAQSAERTAGLRPNVLMIVTDDQGYGELSCHGNPVLQTPNLDRLYAESVRFTDFHVAPMCTPTRGQLMTGVDALRNGAMNVSSGRSLLRRTFPTMGNLFAASGWQTGLFGKWHLGDDGVLTSGPAWPIASARIRVGGIEQRAKVDSESHSVRFVLTLPAGRTTLQTWLDDDDGQTFCGAYCVQVERLRTTPPVKLILDIDMSGDCDDAGALALLNALADRGECELLAVVTYRKDLANASAAAVDAINTYYGWPNIPIGTDKQGPTASQRTSPYTGALRDEFPNDIGPDDRAPDALEIYRKTLAAQPDDSVTICSVGALSNLAELCRREPALVRAKVKRLVVMGGEFPNSKRPETNIKTHCEAAQVVAAQWPGEIVWHGFEVGNVLITGERLKQTPRTNPVRRGYELRQHAGRASIDGGQPSYDQAAALFAVRGAEPQYWETVIGGRAIVDDEGMTSWQPDTAANQCYVKIVGDPARLAAEIEALMIAPPKNQTPGESK